MKTNLDRATEIVVAMINNGRIDKDPDGNHNAVESVISNLEKIVNKLDELQQKPGKAKSINSSDLDSIIV